MTFLAEREMILGQIVELPIGSRRHEGAEEISFDVWLASMGYYGDNLVLRVEAVKRPVVKLGKHLWKWF